MNNSINQTVRRLELPSFDKIPAKRLISIVGFIRTSAFLIIGLCTFSLAASDNSGLQNLSSIQMQAEGFILQYPYQTPYPVRMKLGHLDSRLRLKACRSALNISFNRPNVIWGQTALKISCPGKAWKIHLPVRIDVFNDVLVAAKPLMRGQIIDEKMTRLEKKRISALNGSFFDSQDQLVNLEVKRTLRRGNIITSAHLAPKLMVKSGQMVTLILDYKGITIKSSGKALRSARLGEVVKVRNSQSLRIVEGVVSAEATVRVQI
ncbi:MAG: flagella basal body P-ring formation protein FlgA [Gammaproteobacteria bacterium]|jgi:flagella basal body P-ring formation protein FlgA